MRKTEEEFVPTPDAVLRERLLRAVDAVARWSCKRGDLRKTEIESRRRRALFVGLAEGLGLEVDVMGGDSPWGDVRVRRPGDRRPSKGLTNRMPLVYLTHRKYIELVRFCPPEFETFRLDPEERRRIHKPTCLARFVWDGDEASAVRALRALMDVAVPRQP